MNWLDLKDQWPEGEAGIAYRWDAVCQMVDRGPDGVTLLGRLLEPLFLGSPSVEQVINIFLKPVYNHLVHHLRDTNVKLYLLLRYKRWAEWFETERLRGVYATEGETGLDRDLRRFLFESGIDYPLSQPRSPRGQADIVADLDTDEPLVLEVKVWDSGKDYKENRVRDGLRQVMDYADKYGKDKGYVPVFNLDTEPLVFVPEADGIEWPARIERGGKTYFFVAINVAEQQEPISERDKGKLVTTNEVRLDELFRGFENV
jgi:hypothetical protein